MYDRDTGLFRKLVDQLTAIHTYHISPNYGQDSNTNNLEQYLKDPAYGVSTVTQKYPICVCITPRSRPTRINGARWEQFFFTIYFLQRTGVDGQNKLRSLDKDTNQSTHQVWYDWAEMKTAAIQFIDLFELTIKGDVVVNSETIKFRRILNVDFDKMDIRRLSNFNNDKISGIELNFACYLDISECTLVVGDIEYLVSTTLPEVDPVWEEEKGDYYTKEETNALLSQVSATDSVIGETLTGVVNGSNTVFGTSELFATGKIMVFRNGQRQRGDGNDYEELDNQTIQFIIPPIRGIITADYFKL